jgi:hypothetical protein
LILGTCKICRGVSHLGTVWQNIGLFTLKNKVCCIVAGKIHFPLKCCATPNIFTLLTQHTHTHTHTHQTHCFISIASLVMRKHHDVKLFAQGLYCFLGTPVASWTCWTQFKMCNILKSVWARVLFFFLSPHLSNVCRAFLISEFYILMFWMLAKKYCYSWTEWIQIDASNCTIKSMNVSFFCCFNQSYCRVPNLHMSLVYL